MKALPLGYSDFSRLRQEQGIYVDKTQLISRLVHEGNYYFLSRPRRFGKTLLLSTFESLFKYGLRDFKDLAIKEHWQDTKTYKVIRIDFTACNRFSNIAEFKQSFDALIKRCCYTAGVELPSKNSDYGIETVIDQFETAMNAMGDELVVMLIDEYDHPLNICLDNQELFSDVSSELAQFYSCLKRVSGHLRFLFITGICRYRNLSGFTSGNYISDLSMSPTYGTLLGYTEDELQKYFGKHIEYASKVLGISQAECLQRLKEYYDGFCFDHQASTHVFVPWSTLSFLKDPANGFRNYWFESAGHSHVLLNYLKKHSLKDPEEYGQDRLVTLREIATSQELDQVSDLALLNETGYLTIKSNAEHDRVVLNYPNKEVADSMASLYWETMFKDRSPDSVAQLTAQEIFLQDDSDAIMLGLNRVFSCIDYMNYPVISESSLRSHLQMYLIGYGIKVDIERHNAYGRSDLEFVIADKYFVMELKFAHKGDEPQKLLTKAVEQIKERHYGNGVSSLTILKLALVFSESTKQFVECCFVED